jgi:Outer membrane protein beta-barrel domain
VRHTRLFLVIFAITLGLAENAAAQASESRWTFGATGGFGRTWDDEGGIGSGWLIGGYVDRRLSQNVDVEVAGDLLKNRRTDAFEADGHTTYLSAQIIRRFGSRDANFFLMGGGALAIYRGTTGFSDGSFHMEHSSTNAGFIFGGGMSFHTASNLEIAPIVRMTLMYIEDDSDPWSTITAGIRIGFR